MAQFTKKAIVDSFVKLLEEKPFDKITVKDIVEDCGVNRGTFYYYFEDIYALLKDYFEEELKQIVESHDLYDSWQEGFLVATQLARSSKRQLYHAYNSISREEMDRYLNEVSGHLMREFIEQQCQGLDVAEEDKALIGQFYTCALVGLIARWLDDGMKEDPEKYINRIGELFDGNIRMVLERADRKSSTNRPKC